MLEILNFPQHQINFWYRAPHEVKSFVNEWAIVTAIATRILLAYTRNISIILASRGFSIGEAAAFSGLLTYFFFTSMVGYHCYTDKKA